MKRKTLVIGLASVLALLLICVGVMTAGGSVDEHALARLDVGVLDQGLPRGERHQRQRAGLHVVE